MYYKMIYESPLGPMILAASDTALVGAWFDGQKYCYFFVGTVLARSALMLYNKDWICKERIEHT